MSEACNQKMSEACNQIVIKCPAAQMFEDKLLEMNDKCNERVDEIQKVASQEIEKVRNTGYEAGYKQAVIDLTTATKLEKEEAHHMSKRFCGCNELIRKRDTVPGANELIEETLDRMMDACDTSGEIKVDRDTMIKAVSLIYTMVPRLLKAEELREGEVVYCEYTGGMIRKWFVSTIVDGKIYYSGEKGMSGYDRLSAYGKMWRAWTFNPTEEQKAREEWRE